MASLYVFSFIAGIFATLGVPRFISGVTGVRYNSIFGKSVSAIEDVVFGWVSLVIAAVLLHFSHPWAHVYRAAGLFGVATLITAIALAYVGESKKTIKH
jgi:hypothetical protein